MAEYCFSTKIIVTLVTQAKLRFAVFFPLPSFCLSSLLIGDDGNSKGMEPKACLTEATYKCEFSLISRDFFQEITDVKVKDLLDKYRRRKENRKKFLGTHRNNTQSFPPCPVLQLELLCATGLQLIEDNVRISFSLTYRSGISSFVFYRPAKGDEKRPGSVSYFPHAFPRPS